MLLYVYVYTRAAGAEQFFIDFRLRLKPGPLKVSGLFLWLLTRDKRRLRKEEGMPKLKKPIAIYYEHQHWFVPLFKELERRGVPFVRIDAAQHHFDPAHLNGEGGYSLVFNRMSPSAYRRGHGQAIFYTLYYLDHLEQRGKRIVNGQKAFRVSDGRR